MALEGKGLERIGDLVDIPEIKTVIQLEDLKDPGLARMIVETFVLTGEALDNLKAVLTGLCRGEGRGIFLKGHFGSGKSHFLGMLSLLLRSQEAWITLDQQSGDLRVFQEKLQGLNFLVVELSLVRHRASEFLEDIVLEEVFRALGHGKDVGTRASDSRHAAFARLREMMREQGYTGMVLLVDELSEFLRSKADARSFNEDIRFLQYLGEEARAFPLWIIATLQEWIEETGEIHQDTFNKIKDRYPVRLLLGRAHIEELISDRLIRHREGADSTIEALFDELKSYFPSFPVTRERFLRLYPVHPSTCWLLDRLKSLFSEHRGVVDFIHYRLKGDAERQIPSWLDRPRDQLLTPEQIFDHFVERIRERAETQVYVERVFEGCVEEIPELFKDQDQRRLAVSAVKLLILLGISPSRTRYTVRRLAEMILFPVTSLDWEMNYQFLNDILQRLAAQGSYVRVEPHEDPLENRYFLDLESDISGLMRRRIRHAASQLFPEDQRLFRQLAPMVETPYLPVSGWLRKEKHQVTVHWQHTRRIGILQLRQLNDLPPEEIASLGSRWQSSEEDFFIMVGTPLDRDKQYEHVKKALIPLIQKEFPSMFLFWIPAPFGDDEGALKEVLAAVLIRGEIDAGSSEKGRAMDDFLRAFIQGRRDNLVDIFHRAYFNGTLILDENRFELSPLGYLKQEKFLAEFVSPLLERRFPGHTRVQPYMTPLAPGILKEMLKDFLCAGTVEVDARSKHGLRDILEGLLKPMGLVRRSGRKYELHVNPKQNELVRRFMEAMGERKTVPLEEMYWSFRKGEYGLLMPHFEILVLAMLFSGNLVGYKGMFRKGLDELTRTGIRGITALGKGEVLEEGLQKALSANPLVPARFKGVPMTLSLQEELWEELKARKGPALEELAALGSRIRWASGFEAFGSMPWQELLGQMEDLASHWEAVKVTLPSKEGLERFIRAGEEDPFLEKKLKEIEAVKTFLSQAERLLFIYQYLKDPRLNIPAAEEYLASRGEIQYGSGQGAIGEPGPESGVAALGREREEILRFFHDKALPPSSGPGPEGLFRRFQGFQDAYAGIYADAHRRERGEERFRYYEKIVHSRAYKLLKRLDRLEMISVEHNLRSVEEALFAVLAHRCGKSPLEELPARPICSCGFQLGEKLSLKSIKEIEAHIHLGISETLSALKEPPIQEKIVPYLKGLDLVQKGAEAEEVRLFLDIPADDHNLLERLEGALSSRVVFHINEAFRGKVVLVERDLDHLYQTLVHRKYTLSQARGIIADWLDEGSVGRETFLHFVGRGGDRAPHGVRDRFRKFLEGTSPGLISFYSRVGHDLTAAAILAVLWAEQYGMAPREILRTFPEMEREVKGEDEGLPGLLLDSGKVLRDRDPALLESLVSRAEEEEGFIQSLWSAVSTISPAEVFSRESLFPTILKEAFERIVGGGPENTDLKGLPGGGRDTGWHPLFLERKGEMLDLLETYDLYREKRRDLNPPEDLPPDKYARWESFFTGTLSPLPGLGQGLLEGLRKTGLQISPSIKEEQRAVMKGIEDAVEEFRAFYRRAFPVWEGGGGPRPLMIEDIPDLLSKMRKVPDHVGRQFMLMDGMRWDLWQRIREDFFERRPDLFRVVREGSLWARMPTDTGTQLCRFEDILRDLEGAREGGIPLWKLSGIDEKVHSEKGPLSHLFGNVISYLEIDWLHRLKRLPPRTLLILFADHGFVENPAFEPSAKYDDPRYTHGKDSPFEVIVPWAWVMRV